MTFIHCSIHSSTNTEWCPFICEALCYALEITTWIQYYYCSYGVYRTYSVMEDPSPTFIDHDFMGCLFFCWKDQLYIWGYTFLVAEHPIPWAGFWVSTTFIFPYKDSSNVISCLKLISPTPHSRGQGTSVTCPSLYARHLEQHQANSRCTINTR